MPSAEFWNARVAAANPPIRQSETRIPERPDQTDFLQKWYDWHRGYRIIKHDNGREEHHSMIGERLEDVAPGYLPRTLDELRATSYISGIVSNQTSTESSQIVDQSSTGGLNANIDSLSGPSAVSDEDPIDPEDRIFDPPEITSPTTLSLTTLLSTNTLSTTSLPIVSSPIPSISTTLQMRTPSRTTSHADRARQAEYQARRVAALRRELSRMRSGIGRVLSGLQELGEHIPDSQDAVRSSANLDSRLQVLQNRLTGTRGLEHIGALPDQLANDTRDTMDSTPGALERLPGILDLVRNDLQLSLQQRLEAARDAEGWTRRQRELVAVRLEEIESEAQAATERRRQLEREVRMHEQNARIFGTREEVERQGAEYESPIGGLFTRAYARYGAREEERRQEQLLQEIFEAGERFVADDDGEEASQPDRYQSGGPRPPPTTAMERTMRATSSILMDREETAEERRERADVARLGQLRQHNIILDEDVGGNSLLQDLERRAPDRRYGHSATMRRQMAPAADHLDPELDIDDMDEHVSSENVQEELAGLDINDGRPAPKTDEEMMVKSECKICYGQLATVAILPCGQSRL